jgi:hypothetical protein
MSAAPILARAKQRSSASSSSGSSQLAPSRSGHLSRKPQQHVPGRSMVGGRSQSQGYRTSNGVVGGRTSSRPPSATALVGNLATTYKQLQIDIKKLKDDHEIQASSPVNYSSCRFKVLTCVLLCVLLRNVLSKTLRETQTPPQTT